jgi:Tat protein secretion system quality control protein TatD with DNase activity
MRQLVDTHAHICDPVFDDDRSEVLARAGDVGITAIIAVAEDLSDARKNISTQEVMEAVLENSQTLYSNIFRRF